MIALLIAAAVQVQPMPALAAAKCVAVAEFAHDFYVEHPEGVTAADRPFAEPYRRLRPLAQQAYVDAKTREGLSPGDAQNVYDAAVAGILETPGTSEAVSRACWAAFGIDAPK